MSYVATSRPAAAGPGRIFDRVGSALRSMLEEFAGVWRYALARREFNRVDDSTLRDLGMCRSEFDSYWAETHGRAERTRVRVIRHIPGRNRP
jgi:hypothetical protein